MPATTFDPDAYLASKQAKAAVPAEGFDPNSYLQAKGVALAEPAAQPAPSTEIPRPDATSGPTYRMDPFARTGYLMGTPQGKQAMAQTAQVVKNLGLEGGGVALGQAAGAPLAEFGGVPIGGALGGMAGNAAAQLTGDSPFSFGQMLAAGAAGMVPGASLAKANAKELITQGAKLGVANLAGSNLGSFVDTGKPSSLGQDALAFGSGMVAPVLGKALDQGTNASATAIRRSEGTPMKQVLNDAADLGLVVPPVVSTPPSMKPSNLNKTLHVLGGGSDVVAKAKEINQPATVQAIRDELGFKPGDQMDLPALNAKVVGTNFVYDKIAKVSPQANYAMEQFKENTANAGKAFSAYNASQTKIPAQLEIAKGFQRDAQAAADLLEQELRDRGQASLFKEFQDSRKLRAQLELTKEAITPGGRINADVFGNAYEAGIPLTGNFLKLGRVQSEFNKYLATQPVLPSATGGSLIRHALGYIPRTAILSPMGQAVLNSPFYGSSAPDFAAQVAKFSTMAAGRSKPADVGDEPLSESEMALLEELKARQ